VLAPSAVYLCDHQSGTFLGLADIEHSDTKVLYRKKKDLVLLMFFYANAPRIEICYLTALALPQDLFFC